MAPIPRVVRLRAESDRFSPPLSFDSFISWSSGLVSNNLLFDIGVLYQDMVKVINTNVTFFFKN